MSKNFKSIIRDRYKGRGNCWVKIPKDSFAYTKMIETVSSLNCTEFLKHIEREGFGWVRFSKPSGTESDQYCLFEVRHRGSKIDHPDTILSLPDSVAKTLPLLGNTPVKLELEIDPSFRKTKKQDSVIKRRKSNKLVKLENKDLNQHKAKIEVISEASLTNTTASELRAWEAFLKAEDLLEHSIDY